MVCEAFETKQEQQQQEEEEEPETTYQTAQMEYTTNMWQSNEEVNRSNQRLNQDDQVTEFRTTGDGNDG